MEAPEYFAESWNSQSTPEKQGKDHFVVEDLLDFSNQEDDDSGVGAGEEEACVEDATGNSTECSAATAVDSTNSSLSGELLADAGDLCEPLQHEELAELEWLSNFVEESFTSEEDLQKLQLISGVQSTSSEATRVPVQSSYEKITDETPAADHFLPEAPSVPAKARSKRSRAAPCNWSSRLLVLPPNADSAAASSSSDSDSVVIDAPKKQAAPRKREPGPASAAPPADGRRCLHCATDRTPQWRTGPMGPKTLCNACGVRYKSGRLVPEYRPASSPTFVLSRHSNSHRKVLELRRQKEMDQHQHALLHAGNSVYDRGAAAAAGDEFLIHKRLCPDFRQLI
ncbi:uncharacterized protein M6B38_354125 [Iris pallida]|uniref:GATA transcription factor n=1 Tax=Iris pallida TaxID=29817 RepID=A0AAX6GQ92_IRIPA|nr:uncharacterized protein M6B38_354125 [Iris pallida]